jgi:RNA polymerase sigma-70 factor, ECF subfamily
MQASAAEDPGVGAALATRISAGDAAAENEIVRRYERGVLAILNKTTHDRELARDLCQDTFVIVLKRLRSAPLEDPARLAGFIAQTARNLLIAEKRRFVRRKTDAASDNIDEIPDAGPARIETSEAESAATAVRDILRHLSNERDRMAIVRYYLNEESKESICAELGLTEKHFNLVLFRARDRMRALIDKHGFKKSDLLGILL